MSKPSDKKMLDHLIAVDRKDFPEASRNERYSRVARKTGIGRTTLFQVANGASLSREAKRSGLVKAYKKLVTRKGDSLYQKREDRVYSASPRELDQEYGPLSEFYLDGVLDRNLPVAARLLEGLLGQKVVFDWLKARRTKVGFEPRRFLTPEADLIAKASKALEALQLLFDENEDAPDGLFPDADGKPILKASSYRLLRARFRNDFMGWQFVFEQDISVRAERLKKAYESTDISRDFQWLHEIEPDEIAWLYNPFMVATHAADWAEALRLLDILLSQYPHMLTDGDSGITALVDDLDAIPGLAAALASKNNPTLDQLRANLAELGAERPLLEAALAASADAIAAQKPYFEVYELAQTAMGATK